MVAVVDVDVVCPFLVVLPSPLTLTLPLSLPLSLSVEVDTTVEVDAAVALLGVKNDLLVPTLWTAESEAETEAEAETERGVICTENRLHSWTNLRMIGKELHYQTDESHLGRSDKKNQVVYEKIKKMQWR